MWKVGFVKNFADINWSIDIWYMIRMIYVYCIRSFLLYDTGFHVYLFVRGVWETQDKFNSSIGVLQARLKKPTVQALVPFQWLALGWRLQSVEGSHQLQRLSLENPNQGLLQKMLHLQNSVGPIIRYMIILYVYI